MPALADLIAQQAQAQGVPPSIALAVATQESGISQWNPDGTLVTGTSGEIGVFQIMPATARGLGVDPTDVDQNIQGGISLLAQLYQRFGNWAQALSAYNSGSPNGSPAYASSVLAIAGASAPGVAAPSLDMVSDDSGDDTAPSASPLVVGALIVGGVALAWWALD
jgi:soluble lytic murein transglycosylase-like protein